ncbi:MAG: YraN family protein [Gammaproteobacteria bacterium]|nr:MAG: YraN family protein [Gammaproteobacteria bacterium]RKZ96141.1 MAG: YraN family protein [Gammaproteobacteria bacterium]RKZ98421.1 MAG: YraN family protein [Gammaproteobacteria bacterium]
MTLSINVKQNRGKQAEQLALTYLQQQGLSLVTRNFHSRRGEIDLIMMDKETLVFIEVRYRKSSKYGSALESVNHTKQSRIIHTAKIFLQQHSGNHLECRFDVVAISPNNNTSEVIWVKDAFQLN